MCALSGGVHPALIAEKRCTAGELIKKQHLDADESTKGMCRNELLHTYLSRPGRQCSPAIAGNSSVTVVITSHRCLPSASSASRLPFVLDPMVSLPSLIDQSIHIFDSFTVECGTTLLNVPATHKLWGSLNETTFISSADAED